MLKRWLFTLAPLSATCVTLAVTTGTASAGGANVVTVLHQQNAAIRSSGIVGRISRLEHARHTRANLTRLARAFDVYGREVERAATAVSHSSADSTAQATGRHQWVVAAHDIAKSVFKFAHAYRDELKGQRAAAQRLYRVAERERRAGLAAERRAVALLS